VKLNKLTRKMIERCCDEQVYQRGRDYYRSGRVRNRLKTARGLKAEVRGTMVYDVSITERRGELIAVCTCPFAETWPGYCKHIVATLLAWIAEPESFASTKGWQKTLRRKTKDELIEILGQICEVHPQIAQDFLGVGERGFDPRAAVQEALEAFAPPDGCTAGELVRRLEPIAQRAEAALVRGDAEMARRIYYELTLGCLRVEDEYGSTEIFPDGLVYSFAQGYHEAVEADPEREQKAKLILEEMAKMERSELAEIEGIYFGEVRELLAQGQKRGVGSNQRAAKR
jgi:hypothetical protein